MRGAVGRCLRRAPSTFKAICLAICLAIFLGACQPDRAGQVLLSAPECTDTPVPIGSVQGHNGASPLHGQPVLVRGIVTRQLPAGGFYLQQPAASADDDPLTSDALLVQLAATAQPAGVVPGSELMVAGLVDELALSAGSATDADVAAITLLTDAVASLCAQGQPVPLYWPELTVDAAALEHMHVGLRDWQVAAAMRPRRNDQVTDEATDQAMSGSLLVASQPLYQPTQVVLPGSAARRLAASNRDHAVNLQLSGFAAEQAWQMRAGDRVSVTGIVQPHADGAQLIATADFRLGKTAVVEPAPPRQPETLRVLGLNVQNLFNGDGQGQGFPTPRGAATAVEYRLQLQQLVDAIAALQPDLLALQELENDGFDEHSSSQQLRAALSERLQQPWAVVQTAAGQTLGSDAISVGLLYREGVLTAEGAAQTLPSAPFDQLSRVPLAQRFRSREGNLSFIVSVNHFKSKGGCPESAQDNGLEPDSGLGSSQGTGQSRSGNSSGNADADDGQACWNAARVQSAQRLQQWLTTLQQQQTEQHALIIGDLNAYRMEQPIQTLTRNGWIDLVSRFQSMPLYSYRYRGRIGTLDYALASPALLPRVAGAWYWNVNADASGRRQQRFQPGARFSDHDPVVVDLRLY